MLLGSGLSTVSLLGNPLVPLFSTMPTPTLSTWPCSGPSSRGQQVTSKIGCQTRCEVLNMDQCLWEACVTGTSRERGTARCHTRFRGWELGATPPHCSRVDPAWPGYPSGEPGG